MVYFFIPDGFLGFSRGVLLCNFSSKSTPILFYKWGRFFKFYDFFEGNRFPSFFRNFLRFLIAVLVMGFLLKKIIYFNMLVSYFFMLTP